MRNIANLNMFGHIGHIWPPSFNMLDVKFDHFQTLANMLLDVATGWPKVHNMLHPTMLQYTNL